MCLHVPAVITSKVAVLGRLTEVSIADTEANLWHRVTRMLITGVGRESRDSISRHAPFTVEKAFEVVPGAAEFDPIDRVGVVPHDSVIVGSLRVHIEVKVLVEVDIAWGDVMEHGCVALAVLHPAFVGIIARAGHKSVVGVVLDLDREPDGLIAVNHVVVPEGLHGYAAEEIRQRRDGVGKAAEGWGRLDCVIN